MFNTFPPPNNVGVTTSRTAAVVFINPTFVVPQYRAQPLNKPTFPTRKAPYLFNNM